MALNSDLVVRALNCHGQQLTSFLKDNAFFKTLDLRNVDYQLYHKRSHKMEDRGKKLLLHRFMAQNMETLFGLRRTLEKEKTRRFFSEKKEEEEISAVLPPLETFLEGNEEERRLRFFRLLEEDDILCCRVVAKNMAGLMLTVQSFSSQEKSRFVEDLKIKCFCPALEMQSGNYDHGDFVRVIVLEIKRDSQRLLVGMKSEKTKLGLVSSLPSSLNYAIQAKERRIPSMEVFLKRSDGFINPTNVEYLADELSLTSKSSSLLGSLFEEIPSDKRALALRRRQSSKWAFPHVASGIKYFKSGNNIEAFQCLNQALNIDPGNVEGLVARGALYANNGSLEKAVEDFEKALSFDGHHRNARKYLCETVIAQARSFERDNKPELAMDMYRTVLKHDPKNSEAVDSINYLKGRSKELLHSEKSCEIREKLKLLLEDESDDSKKRKSDHSRHHRSRSHHHHHRRRHRRHRSSSCTSSGSRSGRRYSSSSGSGSSSNNRARSNGKRSRSKSKTSQDKKMKESATTSPRKSSSPFSQKMASNTGGDVGVFLSHLPEDVIIPKMSDKNSHDDIAVPEEEEVQQPNYHHVINDYSAPPPPLGSMLLPPPPAAPAPAPAAAGFQYIGSYQPDPEYEKRVDQFLAETSSKYRRRSHGCSESSEKKRKKSRRRTTPSSSISSVSDIEIEDLDRKLNKYFKETESRKLNQKEETKRRKFMEEKTSSSSPKSVFDDTEARSKRKKSDEIPSEKEKEQRIIRIRRDFRKHSSNKDAGVVAHEERKNTECEEKITEQRIVRKFSSPSASPLRGGVRRTPSETFSRPRSRSRSRSRTWTKSQDKIHPGDNERDRKKIISDHSRMMDTLGLPKPVPLRQENCSKKTNFPNTESIIPGKESFEDLEAFVIKKRKEKVEQIKKAFRK